MTDLQKPTAAEIDVTLKGITPLLCNRYVERPEPEPTIDGESNERDVESRLYLGEDGNPVIPRENLVRAIIEAGEFVNYGGVRLTTERTSWILAFFAIPEAEIPIIHAEPWTVDTRLVRERSSGRKIRCHRPCFPDWRLRFDAYLETSILPESTLRLVFALAGKAIGLGDFRPARRGSFGKFIVESWSVREI